MMQKHVQVEITKNRKALHSTMLNKNASLMSKIPAEQQFAILIVSKVLDRFNWAKL